MDLQLAGDAAELAEEVHPLAHPQVVEVLLAAHPAELVARQLTLLRAQVVPQGDDRQQVGSVDLEPVVELGGLLAFVLRAFARILDRQRRRDHQHLAHTAEPFGLQHHPPESRIDRESGQVTPDLREAPWRGLQTLGSGLHGGQLVEQRVSVDDRPMVGWVEEREPGDVAQPDRGHLQDDRCQVRAQDLGIGELGTRVEVVLGEQPDADAGSDATTATGALVGRSLRDRLDRQTLHLQPMAVARDARRTGVDDVPDARHRQRGLGDVGGEDDATAGSARRRAFEDPVLLGRREPGVQRQHLGGAQVESPERVGGVVDLALARQEHEHVTRPLVRQLLDGVDDRLHLVPRLPTLLL